jgi:hypothetical protein
MRRSIVFALVLACALCLGAAASGGSPVFDGPLVIGTCSGNGPVATGDFNGDGIPDLVVDCGSSISVQLGVGDGTFQGGTSYGIAASSYSPESFGIADFNGDGALDIAVDAANGVDVLLGNGDGTFGSATFFAASPTYYTEGLAVADFNGDGIPDLATTSAADSYGALWVLLGNGSGGFGTAHGTTIGYQGSGLAVGDFDNNGTQDVVVGDSGDPQDRFLPGNGDGTFGAGWLVNTGHSLDENLVVGDFNGDGNLDYAETNLDYNGHSGYGTINVALGNGNGTFSSTDYYANGTQPSGLAVGDFNGDGAPDLVTYSYHDNTVTVLTNNGAGGFQAEAPAGIAKPQGIAVADLNNHGDPDLIVSDSTHVKEFVYLNDNPAFTSAEIPAPDPTPTGSVLIDQLRLTGPGNLHDAYVELYNAATFARSIGGWQLQESRGAFSTIPYGTVIPAFGHLLLTAPAGGYALQSVATGDVTLPFWSYRGEPANGGVRLVALGGAVADAVGFQGAPTTFYTGTPLTVPGTPPTGEYTWVRKSSGGLPVNTGNNSADFTFVSTSDNDSGHGSPVLGTASPSGLRSPSWHNDILQSSLLDPSVSATAYPNRVYTAGSPGTLIVNRTLWNCSGQPQTGACANAASGTRAMTVTKLRFRITGLTTLNSPVAGGRQAVLAADTSNGESGLSDANANSCNGSRAVLGLPLDAPSSSGAGGLGATWTATAELPAGGLAPGGCVNVEFEFDVAQTGTFSFSYNAEDDLEAVPLTVKPPLPPGKSVTPKSVCPTPSVKPVPATDTGTLTRVSTPVPKAKRTTVLVAKCPTR